MVLPFRGIELIGARWSEIDFKDADWQVPRDRIKTRASNPRPFLMPPPPLALKLLRELRRFTGDNQYLFPGVLLANGSDLRCWDCIVVDQDRGFLLEEGASLGLSNATVQAARAIDARGGTRVYRLFNSTQSTLEGSVDAIRLFSSASVDLRDDAIIGTLDLRQKSIATLRNITQTVSSGTNRLRSGSSLVLRGTTSMSGDISLGEFSELTMPGGTTVSGSLSCGRGADAFCDDPLASVGGTSNCGQCPKP